MPNFQKANELIELFAERMENPLPGKEKGKLYAGVDLGTAYVVLAVVDEEGMPVAGAMQFAQVVRDGIVVDYIGALEIVKKLKAQIESNLGSEFEIAAASYPPGTREGIEKTITYILEGAGMITQAMVDEPTAANNVLEVTDGAVVDIGGGTTGISIIKDGKVVHNVDEPTGGTHLSLVIAGAYNVGFEEAEKMKTNLTKQEELMPVVKPVFQKMASIINKHIKSYEVEAVYLVGGTSCFKEIDKVIEKEVGVPVFLPDNPLLVTPLGIALSLTSDYNLRKGVAI